MIISRILLGNINKLKKSVLLIGPRQAGKSTLMKSLSPDLTIDLSNEEEFSKYLSDKGLLTKTTQPHQTILIDEVQRIPSLLNTVQSIIDKSPTKRFLLTGQALGVRKL